MPPKDNDLTGAGLQGDTRRSILAAALEIYSKYGFRGATTRRIADTAGVNEVTIFRHFGSKDVLLTEALRARPSDEAHAPLPSEPRNPLAELTAWSQDELHYLRSKRSMIRTCMGEIEERPELTETAACSPRTAFAELCEYFVRLRQAGMSFEDFDERISAVTLMGALFSDAMGREMMPEIFPPLDTAAKEYARLILRAIGADESSRSVFADATGAPRG